MSTVLTTLMMTGRLRTSTTVCCPVKAQKAGSAQLRPCLNVVYDVVFSYRYFSLTGLTALPSERVPISYVEIRLFWKQKAPAFDLGAVIY